MALTPIDIVGSITLILLVGALTGLLSARLRLPDVLLLILAGMIIGHIPFQGQQVIEFPPLFLTSMSVVALALIIFNSTIHIKLRDLDEYSIQALKVTGYSILFNMTLFCFLSTLWGFSAATAVLFSSLLAGSSAEGILAALKGREHPLMNVIKLESIFNTPITVILPFLVISLFFASDGTSVLDQVIGSFTPFLTKIVAGIGAGIFVGIVLFKILQRKYDEIYTPLAVILAALSAFVIAEKLGGDGVLATTALGLFFGNAVLRERMELIKVESVITNALYLFVFVLIGLVIKIPLTLGFFVQSAALFALYIFVRYMAVSIALRKEDYLPRERLFAALTTQKGIATATVVFTIAIMYAGQRPDFGLMLDMAFAFILYSIIVSSIISQSAQHFLREQEPQTPQGKRRKAKK